MKKGSKNKQDKKSEMVCKNKKVLLFCGGHAGTTAIATIQQLLKHEHSKQFYLHWVGAKYAFEGKKIPTLESFSLSELGITQHTLSTGKMQTKFTFWTIPSLLKIPLGFIHAFLLLKRIKPIIIVSFGGYISVPIVIIGKIMRIPVILHEQTVVAGRANKLTARFSDLIALARKSSSRYFPKDKCVVLGNPVMEEIAKVKPKDRIGNLPTILVLGGSRGAKIINILIKKKMIELLNY